MTSTRGDYWTATRHPWSCILFVLPLLAIYEVGLHFLGPPADSLRNGADVWLRSGLASAGITPLYAAPIVLVAILLSWTLIHRERFPRDPVGVWVGMTCESMVFAALLFGLCKALWPVFGTLRTALAQNSTSAGAEPALVNLVRYLGAGIYEETLFRLLLFSALLAMLEAASVPRRWGLALAVLASALLFAGAHNLGPHGEAFHDTVFVFRTLAGMFFAWLFCVRGFGIAVGAHAGYDVIVGMVR